MIAILGTGLLGSGFARALRKQGETVHVWNRTFARRRRSRPRARVAFADAGRGGAGREPRPRGRSPTTRRSTPCSAAAQAARAARSCRPHDDIDRRRARADRAVARARRHVPARAGVHGPAERARVDRPDAGVGRPRAWSRRVTPLLAPMTGKLVDLGERVDARGGVQAARQSVPDGARRRASPTCSRSARRWAWRRAEVGDAVRALQPGRPGSRRGSSG